MADADQQPPPSPLLARDAELVALNSAQPSLFAELPDAAAIQENRKEYTAQQLLKRRPEVYRAIAHGLGEGLGVRQLARALGVSHHTVMAVRRNEPHLVATLKKGSAQLMRDVAALAVERLRDEIDDVKLEALPVVVGVLTEKAQLLDGEATQRVETVQGPTHADYAAMLAALEKKAQAIEVEAVPETGFGGEKSGANGGPDAAPGSATGDTEAPVLKSYAAENKQLVKNATGEATGEAPKMDLPSSENGGGGGTPIQEGG